MSAGQLSTCFFLQMACILLACRVVGWLARRIGQPQVVGEMLAGVVLGPSLFGLLAPSVQGALFPPESLGMLYVGAQLGVGLYMFLVGLEFDHSLFTGRLRSAAAVSISGMAAPFALGGLLAVWLVRQPDLFAAQATTLEAVLFLGAAMSITAFPMLARILYERGITGTPLGALALAAGAVDDATAWCILALVVASFGAGPMVAVAAIGGGLAYAVGILVVGRPFLARLGRAADAAGAVTPGLLGVTLMCFMLGAWAMDAIGIHAVFGGFLLGVAMPRGLFAREVRRQLEPFVVVCLLPMFFTYSGLKTRLDLLWDPHSLLIAGLVLVAAVAGKAGACYLAARLTGADARTAAAVGVLMNARGLMELIILNIGLQVGIIEPRLFSVMVFMAIVTTLMATPACEWVYGRHVARPAPGDPVVRG